ncbi:hypothetical protein E3N88_02522 [Mikania micrantha]|uniref:Uncharacterized protein n=1 Tax=Mikania micrantha TaxID=192012 RepID=A0A5N6Q5S6_9ASTR|nr:hypothetical protein E3N88_02522 [Mikania micrantha]
MKTCGQALKSADDRRLLSLLLDQWTATSIAGPVDLSGGTTKRREETGGALHWHHTGSSSDDPPTSHQRTHPIFSHHIQLVTFFYLVVISLAPANTSVPPTHPSLFLASNPAATPPRPLSATAPASSCDITTGLAPYHLSSSLSLNHDFDKPKVFPFSSSPTITRQAKTNSGDQTFDRCVPANGTSVEAAL